MNALAPSLFAFFARPLVTAFACLAFGATVFGAGCSTPADDGCVAGKQCICSGGSCNKTCGGDGASCRFECQAGTSCTFSCPGGGCDVQCAADASCAIDCPKGGCTTQCGGGDCKVTSCTDNCTTQCGSAKTCTSSCIDPAKNCVSNGTSSGGSPFDAGGIDTDF
jgi:hypothetical protein